MSTTGPSRRQSRVADEIRRVIGDVLLHRVSDPRLHDVTITEVEVSGDLRLARIYYTLRGGPDAREAVEAGLARAAGFFKRHLAGGWTLRYLPELEFHYDESLDRGERVDQLLADLARQRDDWTPAAESDAAGDDDEEDS